jgi:hypothetical protein
LVGGDVAVRDFAGGIYLSEAGEAGKRSLEEAGALGETEDISDNQSSKYSQSQPGKESERQ